MKSRCRRPHALVVCGQDELGPATVRALAATGMHVLAAIDRGSGTSELPVGVQVHEIDPLQPEPDLKALAGMIGTHTSRRGLQLVVTRTVTRRPYPLEFASAELLHEHWSTHVVGAVATGQQLLPLLRAGEGRLIVMGTIGGGLTLPFSSILSATGHALRAVADAWRQELHQWGIKVVLVEVAGVHNNDGFETFANEAMAQGPTRMQQLYGRAYSSIMRNAIRQEPNGVSVEEAALGIVRIAAKSRPRSRYSVGNRGRALATLGRVPAPLQDALKRRFLR